MAGKVFTDNSFSSEILQSKLPVVIDFWAEWCPPCKIIGPLFEELAKEYEGKVLIGKMNVDENPQLPGELNVMSLPTIIFFKDGQPIQAIVGAKSKQAYIAEIEKLLRS